MKYRTRAVREKLRERRHRLSVAAHKDFPAGIIKFGKNRGYSFEWLFFNDLNYLRWIYHKLVPAGSQSLTAADVEILTELVSRSERLAPPCSYCRLNRARHMLTQPEVFTFCCDRCWQVYRLSVKTEEVMVPSFLVYDPFGGRADTLLLEGIKRAWPDLANTRYDDEKLRRFFDTETNFWPPPTSGIDWSASP